MNTTRELNTLMPFAQKLSVAIGEAEACLYESVQSAPTQGIVGESLFTSPTHTICGFTRIGPEQLRRERISAYEYLL